MDRRMTSVILWPLVFSACAGLPRAQSDDDLIANVFGTPTTSPQVSCTCMPYHSCDTNHQPPPNTDPNTGPNTDPNTHPNTGPNTPQTPETGDYYGENEIDIRFDPNNTSSGCKHYLDKCCFPADQTTPTPTPPHPTHDPKEPTDNACGIRHPNGVDFRITGGKDHEANYGEFPWMVAVMRRDRVFANVSVRLMECGGSIIHPQVILTGAHCVRVRKDLYIRAGEWDTQTEKEKYPTQDRNVKQVIIHEGYYAGALHNDVALLVLDKALELNPVVGTVCMPNQGENMVGRNCVVSGWGKDVFGRKGEYQVILKRVEQPVLPRGPCQEELRKTRLGSRFKLHESFLCAGGKEGEDACKGDGGSPLVCPSKEDPNVYVQAGIVAWGIGCGTTTPAVYVDVPHFRTWIDNKIATIQFS